MQHSEKKRKLRFWLISLILGAIVAGLSVSGFLLMEGTPPTIAIDLKSPHIGKSASVEITIEEHGKGVRRIWVGLLQGSEPSDDVVALLVEDGTAFTWAAAAVGSQNAAGLQLATELPVMPIGGFNGSDPSPTLAEFQQYVADGRIHYFVAGGGIGPSNGGSSSSTAIANWVTANFESVTIDGTTLYDLTRPG